jgi:hypothetical protein
MQISADDHPDEPEGRRTRKLLLLDCFLRDIHCLFKHRDELIRHHAHFALIPGSLISD